MTEKYLEKTIIETMIFVKLTYLWKFSL